MRREVAILIVAVSSQLGAQSNIAFDSVSASRRSASADSSATDPPRFLDLSAGSAHVCGIALDRQLWCWGANNTGQLGAGDRGDHRSSPRPVGGNDRYVAVSAGAMHTCAITIAGATKCWGFNESGETGSTASAGDCLIGPCSLDPQPVEVAVRFDAIAAGHRHTCAVARGEAWCWGNNARGQAGAATYAAGCAATPCAPPRRIDGLANVVAVASGGSHACALTRDGTAWCWGDNRNGQLGIGQPTVLESSSPRRVITDTRFTSIAAGTWHTCGLGVDGTVACWGDGRAGQLGADQATRSEIPLRESSRRRWSALSAGGRSTCALLPTGEVWCWGSGAGGRLGTPAPDVCDDGPCSRMPLHVPGVIGATSVAVGGRLSCVVERERPVCWGLTPNGSFERSVR